MKDYKQIEHITKYIEERMKHCYDIGYEQGRKDEKEIHEGCEDVTRAFAEGILIGSMSVPKETVPQFPLSDKCCCESCADMRETLKDPEKRKQAGLDFDGDWADFHNKEERMSSQNKRVRVVVDIDEDTYESIKRGKIDSSMHDVPIESVLAIANGVPLSKNVTNGEALCILFPNMRYHFTMTDKSVRVVTTIGVASSFDLDWWNAPYETESEGK